MVYGIWYKIRRWDPAHRTRRPGARAAANFISYIIYHTSYTICYIPCTIYLPYFCYLLIYVFFIYSYTYLYLLILIYVFILIYSYTYFIFITHIINNNCHRVSKKRKAKSVRKLKFAEKAEGEQRPKLQVTKAKGEGVKKDS